MKMSLLANTAQAYSNPALRQAFMTVGKGLDTSPLNCCQWISGAKVIACPFTDPGQMLHGHWWADIESASLIVQNKAGGINDGI